MCLTRAKLSADYRIVIPREIREKLRLVPGLLMMVSERGGLITIIPDQPREKIPDVPLEKSRGIVKGMSTTGLREKKDRF